MKTKVLFLFAVMLSIAVFAAPILQSGWTTTTSADGARIALQAAPTNAPLLFNTTNVGSFDLKTNPSGSVISLRNLGLGYFGALYNLDWGLAYQLGNIFIATNQTGTGGFIGDGSGLTNLPIGVTSSQATNIAAYQALIATQALSTTITSSIAALDNRLFFMPQNQNLNLTNTAYRIRNGKALRILNFGDDAFQPRTPTMATLNSFLKYNGSIGEGGGNFYATYSAGVVQSTLAFGTPIRTYGMPDNSWLTNTGTILTDTIYLQGWRSNAFGTATLYTNDGGAGAYGVVGAVDMNNSTVITAFTTNFPITPGVVKVYLKSSGSNFVNFAGQIHNSIGTNYSWDIWQDGNAAILNTMTNAFTSNSLVTFLANYDLAIFNDATQTNHIWLGHPLLFNAATNRVPTCDVLFLQQPPVTNTVRPSYDVYRSLAAFGETYGANILAVGGMFLPIDPPRLIPYYSADAVHLTTAGNTLLSTPIAMVIANPYAKMGTAPVVGGVGSSFWNTNATGGGATNVNDTSLSVLVRSNTITASGGVSSSNFTLLHTSGSFSGFSGNLSKTSLDFYTSGAFISFWNGAGNANTRVGFSALGDVYVRTNLCAWGGVYATNGFLLPTNGLVANPVAGRSYSTNGSSAVTLGAFASVPNDSTTITYVTHSNSSAAAVAFTGPSGTIGPDGSKPAVAYTPAASEVVYGFFHNAQRSTNMFVLFRTNTVEFTEASRGVGSPLALSTGSPAELTSISLAAGVWDVSGNVLFNYSGATVTVADGDVNLSTATVSGNGDEGHAQLGTTITGISQAAPMTERLNLATTTTVYLNARATFSAGTVSAYGYLKARRAQ